MLASLPMYDLPEIRNVTDGFWAAVAQSYGVKGPLTRAEDWTAPWRNPDLLFSQTCGYPLTHAFKGLLTYVATPHYDADGCDGPYYCSIIFARNAMSLAAFQGRIAAYNSADSMSGLLALKLVFSFWQGDQAFFSKAVETGSHVASLAAVQQGQADVCAIDCVTVALLQRYRPGALEGLLEIARSPQVPALPYVTRKADIFKLRPALQSAVERPQVATALLISAISHLAVEDYDIITQLEHSIRDNVICPHI
jgi:ABC-type phosphate/phosphonate transport system substrate-binding protein